MNLKRAILLMVFMVALLPLILVGAGTYSRVKTWSASETLTASDLNAEFDNILNNSDPDGIDDASTNATAMQATADPYPAASASLATDLRGELQRIRYQLAAITGETYWYIDPDIALSALNGLDASAAELDIAADGISYPPITGDSTAGRVIRISNLTIGDDGDAGTLDVSLASVWNGDTISLVSNLAKDATSGGFSLNAGGTTLTVEASGLTGNAVAIVSADLYVNATGTDLYERCYVSSNDILCESMGLDGAADDLTSLTDAAAEIILKITYLTDA